MSEQDVESFEGSRADLEDAANQLFTSPPRHQPLAFEALSLQTPAKSIPPTPGTALQIKSKLESSLGSRLDIQLDQKMGSFQASILEAMKSMQDDFQKSLKKVTAITSKEAKVDQIPASASKPGNLNLYIWTNSPPPPPPPPRDLSLPSRQWMWTMVHHSPHVWVLIPEAMSPRISLQ